MIETTTIFSALKAAQSVSKFVESRQFTECIVADIALSAAKESLKKASDTATEQGYFAQVRNAVCQLEISLCSHMSYLDSFKPSDEFNIDSCTRFSLYRAKAHYILWLMAVCYTYLDEPVLRDKHLRKAREIRYDYGFTGGGMPASEFAGAFGLAAIRTPFQLIGSVTANRKLYQDHFHNYFEKLGSLSIEEYLGSDIHITYI